MQILAHESSIETFFVHPKKNSLLNFIQFP